MSRLDGFHDVTSEYIAIRLAFGVAIIIYFENFYMQAILCTMGRDGMVKGENAGSWTLQDLRNDLGMPLGLGYTALQRLTPIERVVIRQCRPRI